MGGLMAFDLDGTLTQHKTPLEQENRCVLDELRGRGWSLLMVGAGQCTRIFEQMGRYPVDVIGNYGMQYSRYDAATGRLIPVFDRTAPCNRREIRHRVAGLRERFGFEAFCGESVEFHPSGCVTFPLLGTCAAQADKLAFDPDRSRRRRIYAEVAACFPEYTVFVGGSSSFDMAPRPYDKRYALAEYCAARGLPHSRVVFVGDDYGLGGNDEAVYRSDFGFVKIDDYRRLREALGAWLSGGAGERSF